MLLFPTLAQDPFGRQALNGGPEPFRWRGALNRRKFRRQHRRAGLWIEVAQSQSALMFQQGFEQAAASDDSHELVRRPENGDCVGAEVFKSRHDVGKRS